MPKPKKAPGGNWKTIGHTMQVDVDDPIEDRRTVHGHLRLHLNREEKAAIALRMKTQEALVCFVDKGMGIPEIAKQLGVDPLELAALAISPQFTDFRAAVVQRATEQFLDYEKAHTWNDIQNHLGLSRRQLRSVVESDEFKEAYRQLYNSLVASPTLPMAQAAMQEHLLPLSVREAKELLLHGGSTAKSKMIEMIWRYAGLEAAPSQSSDKDEAIKFLQQAGVQIKDSNVVFVVSEEYRKALADKLEVVDGEVKG